MPRVDNMKRAALRAFLARGPASAREAMAHLSINQTAFSRLVEASRPDVLSVGRSRGTRYLASREIPAAGRALPVFEIADDGSARQLGTLHGVLPDPAFFFESLTGDASSGFFRDLPYFLHELRPSGFLGRLVPRQHPDLQLPADISLLTANQCVSYISRFGWNLSGNLVVGQEAFRLYLQHALEPRDLVSLEERAARYPRLADDVLSLGVPGSSAGGEQPKFLVTRTPGPRSVLVKFSPPVTDPSSRRTADLLIAEALALETMRAHGHAAARAEVVEAGGRVFLETERFDRLPGGGRRGLISLYALDAEHVGHFASWNDTAAALARLGIIDDLTVAEIRRRQLFGALIGNTDMHGGNLSFITRGTTIAGLAPAYDMMPALYALAQGHLRTPPLPVVIPEPADGPHWSAGCAAAQAFWNLVAADPRVSDEFRRVAADNARSLTGASRLQRLLPSGA